jgi:hypothetical protein
VSSFSVAFTSYAIGGSFIGLIVIDIVDVLLSARPSFTLNERLSEPK